MVRIASFNVENLFARPKVFKTTSWNQNQDIFKAYGRVNELLEKAQYTEDDKAEIKALLVTLDIYHVENGAIRRNDTKYPKWAWLRKNRGTFDREPADKTQDVVIEATGRDQWIGWVEFAKEATNETSTRLTARVIEDVNADVQAIVEAEDRPSLIKFNRELLNNRFTHVMLVDGNDERGIDVGVMTKAGFEIRSIHSNVDTLDPVPPNPLFSRDCAEYEIRSPNGTTVFLLINHFKSQSGGGGSKRQRQSAEVARIAKKLAADGKHVIVVGDFNEGPKVANQPPPNLTALFKSSGPLRSVYGLAGFDIGQRDGTFQACGLRDRLDYILLSKSLLPMYQGGGVFRCGLWGKRKSRPDKWDTYQDMSRGDEQASDHAAVWVDLNI